MVRHDLSAQIETNQAGMASIPNIYLTGDGCSNIIKPSRANTYDEIKALFYRNGDILVRKIHQPYINQFRRVACQECLQDINNAYYGQPSDMFE